MRSSLLSARVPSGRSSVSFEADADVVAPLDGVVEQRPRRWSEPVEEPRDLHRDIGQPTLDASDVRRGVVQVLLHRFEEDAKAPGREPAHGEGDRGVLVPQPCLDAHAPVREQAGDVGRSRLVEVHRCEVHQHLPTLDRSEAVARVGQEPCAGADPDGHGDLLPDGSERLGDADAVEGLVPLGVTRVDVQRHRSGGDDRRRVPGQLPRGDRTRRVLRPTSRPVEAPLHQHGWMMARPCGPVCTYRDHRLRRAMIPGAEPGSGARRVAAHRAARRLAPYIDTLLEGHAA